MQMFTCVHVYMCAYGYQRSTLFCFLIFIFIFYVYRYAACMTVHCVHAWYLVPVEARKGCHRLLQLELQIVVNHRVDSKSS